MIATLLERGTKPVIILSGFVVATLTVTTAGGWSALPWVSLVALLGSYVAARRFRTVVLQGWLAITYLAPGLLALGLGGFRLSDLTPWFAGLVGAMLATADPTRWHLPVPWRAPLVAWVLVVAVSWPVVWLRELDFLPSVVGTADLANNGVGVPQDIIHLWVFGVVLAHGLGLLWLDWLCATFSRQEVQRFHRVVLAPLAVGWVMAMLVGVYQAVVDFGFVNPGHWATLRRASGTLMDANPFGMLAALWGGIGVAVVLDQRRQSPGAVSASVSRTALWLTPCVLAASWYGLWISGSRSALLAGGVVLVVVLRSLLPMVKGVSGRVAASGLVGAVVGVALVALLASGAGVAIGSAVGPWQRLAPTLPTASLASVRAFGAELWDRNWYGTSAVQMIVDSPLVGVGVGSFHTLVPDVGFQLGHGRLEPDNAQNWFRHQLAEFGLLGSLGWILWVAMFLRLLFVARPVAARSVTISIVRGVLVALGLASLVGMPTQNIALALTFWTLVFWYLLLVDDTPPVPPVIQPIVLPAIQPVPEPGHTPSVVSWHLPRLTPLRTWIGVWLLALVYVSGLTYVSWIHLRPPLRAQRADWDYSYGFHDPEPSESGGQFRWAAKQAVAVVSVRDRWLEVSTWNHHPDIRERSVEAKVWVDGTLLLDTQRADGEPTTRAVRIPEGQQRVLIETWVDRTWSPSEHGESDTRQLGPGVSWRFIDPCTGSGVGHDAC